MDNNTVGANDVFKSKYSPSVDIEFSDVSYVIKSRENKYILNSVNGKFCSGKLTAILGASGSGKTTLLNVLSGYTTHGLTGNIRINGMPRNKKIFHKLSAYIMQEELQQPLLNVEESMMFAAELKVGNLGSVQQKKAIVMKILDVLGLTDCLETRSEYLSGGQRKRLSIALEMINNPPVIFLDEPTSGLDVVAIKQCMQVLNTLKEQNRTVICTIHQPSTTTLQNFDQVYFLQDGMCIYNGSVSNIVPFLSSAGFECPITYNPSDYIIEIVQISKASIPLLVAKIQNGKINKTKADSGNSSDTQQSIVHENMEKDDAPILNLDFPTTFWTQFCIISSRMMLQTKRHKTVFCLLVFYHIVMALITGALFYKIGNNGIHAIANFKYSISVMIFFVYTYLLSTVLLFPFEVRLVKREFRNHWYDLKPYFLAVNLRGLPLMIVLGVMFVLITYLMTYQPLEIDRFLKFAIAGVLTGIATEGLGLVIGSVFNVTNGALFAPATVAPFLLLSYYGMGYSADLNISMKILTYMSYLHWALVAINQAIFNDRGPFYCPDTEFCYYQDPNDLLKDMGMNDAPYGLHILGLICFIIFFRILAFMLLKLRLTSEFYRNVVYSISKIIESKLL